MHQQLKRVLLIYQDDAEIELYQFLFKHPSLFEIQICNSYENFDNHYQRFVPDIVILHFDKLSDDDYQFLQTISSNTLLRSIIAVAENLEGSNFDIPIEKLKFLDLKERDSFTKRLLEIIEGEQSSQDDDVFSETLKNAQERIFRQMLARSLARSKRHKRIMSLYLFQLRNYAEIQDKLGHFKAQHLMWYISEILQNNLRASDVIHRLDRATFALILEDLADYQNAGTIAKKILAHFRDGISIDERIVNLDCAIGMSCFPDANEETDQIYQHAKHALLLASQNVSRITCFNKSMQQSDFQKDTISDELKKAIEDDEFYILYQPIYNLINGKIFALEAFLRWEHPTLDLIGPKAFLSLAERFNLNNKIIKWLVKHAVSDFQVISKSSPNLKLMLKFPISSLNKQLNFDDSPDSFRELIKSKRVILELKESLLNQFTVKDKNAIKNLEMQGCQFCVSKLSAHDFSMQDISNLAISYLKPDLKCMKNINERSGFEPMMIALKDLSASMGIEIIASGIESRQSLLDYISMQIDYGSGFYLCKPLPLEELIVFLHSDKTRLETILE